MSHQYHSSVWIHRHADRLDLEDSNWLFTEDGLNYVHDTPLSESGFETAKRMGNFIWNHEKDKLIKYDDLNGLKVFSSPFHRCLQTSTIIAETIEANWLQAKGIERKEVVYIKICIDYGLAEDIPDRSYHLREYTGEEKRELISEQINPKEDPRIAKRLDTDHTQLLNPEDRLTYASNEEYDNRVAKVYGALANSGHHTILIGAHLDETFVAYRKLGNVEAVKRYQYGIMANFINNNGKLDIVHPIWEHYKKME